MFPGGSSRGYLSSLVSTRDGAWGALRYVLMWRSGLTGLEKSLRQGWGRSSPSPWEHISPEIISSTSTLFPGCFVSVSVPHGVQVLPPFLALRVANLASRLIYQVPAEEPEDSSLQLGCQPARPKNDVALSLPPILRLKVAPWWRTSSSLQHCRDYPFTF